MQANAEMMVGEGSDAGASVASASGEVSGLSDGELLTKTRLLVGASNQLLATLLAHLAEVEARGLHRTRACSSLYTYCIYELRFSEDAASRRVCAARFVKRFAALFEAIASGELHLTGLLMLGPYLTPENHLEVLARAKHRTKRELAQLVRILDPLPDVPSRIEPLGPAPARGLAAPANPTWTELVRSMCPIRELTPGDRPCDWANDASEGASDGELSFGASCTAVAEAQTAAPARGVPAGAASPSASSAPALGTQSQRYGVQFTATQEHIELVERAKALLSHALPQASLEEIHLRAMQALVRDLEKQKYGSGARRARGGGSDAAGGCSDKPEAPQPETLRRQPSRLPTLPPAGTHPEAPHPEASHSEASHSEAPHQRQRGRCVPAAVRRAVFGRDEGRCSYVDASGRRCRETHFLELHHLHPFAMGGAHTVANLTLRCAAHNALAAENDFGRSLMQQKRESRSRALTD